ncbi:unnamed protein product, partial [Pocillopora meandrina]
KCTVCGGDHSIFRCENRCGHSDSRQCSCNEGPPQKRKKTSKSTASSQQPADTSHDDLKKKYELLQKDYKRVGQAFQNQQEQKQELTALLEECEKEAEELANLVSLKTSRGASRAEVRRRDQPAPQEDPPASQQQHQQTADIHTSTQSLANIQEQYDQVLQTMKENRCSMACAFRLAGCPRSTLRDFMAIAELKKVDSRELDLVLHDQEVKSVQDLEVVCCKRLRCYIPVMINM